MAAMRVDGTPTRTIWPLANADAVEIIDQTALPHAYRVLRLDSLAEVAQAICSMQVRGAPLIGVTAAYGLALAMVRGNDDAALLAAVDTLAATRPTAVNLRWVLARMRRCLAPLPRAERAEAAWQEAARIADEDVEQCRQIGRHGLQLLRSASGARDRLQIMTHCNAGWLATVDYGTALAPVYAAFDAGIDVHVWVSETRPRNQGLLTAWELAQHGVPHTVIADNAAGLLLARGDIDAVIVGADRIAANGDVANKIGTYLKALAAVPPPACPSTSLRRARRSTFSCPSGAAIPIEERAADELRVMHGRDAAGVRGQLQQLPSSEAIVNPAFDVTPARAGKYPDHRTRLLPGERMTGCWHSIRRSDMA
jgi:methylthioribose-1-phosphate isomerase